MERIREVRRRPENRRCFDCLEKSPSSVCMDLATFVCMTCSGIHREFGRKVKSISVSSFTDEEAEMFENGGNEVAKVKWLYNYRESDFAIPTSSETSRIKEFMIIKYVNKRYMKAESSLSLEKSESKSKKGKLKKKKKVKEISEEEPEIRSIEDDFPDLSIVVRHGLAASDEIEEEPKPKKKVKKKKKSKSVVSTPPAPSPQREEPDLLDLFSFSQTEQTSEPFQQTPDSDDLWGFPEQEAAHPSLPQPENVTSDPFADLIGSTPLEGGSAMVQPAPMIQPAPMVQPQFGYPAYLPQQVNPQQQPMMYQLNPAQMQQFQQFLAEQQRQQGHP